MFNILDYWGYTEFSPLRDSKNGCSIWHIHNGLPNGICQSGVLMLREEGEPLPKHINLSVEEEINSLSLDEWEKFYKKVCCLIGIDPDN